MSNASESSKGRFRFSDEFDLHLAREVYGINPYEDPNRWATIQVNMIQITGKCVSLRTLRERIQNLVKKYLAKVGALEGKSGIELEDLLQQISDLMSEFKGKKKILTPYYAAGNKSSYVKGYDAREQSCASFSPKDASALQTSSFQVEAQVYQDQDVPDQVVLECTELQSTSELVNVVGVDCDEKNQMAKENDEIIFLPPKHTAQQTPSKRPLAQANILTPLKRRRRDATSKQTVMQYLEEKNQQQYEIRMKELALQDKRQLLEEKKFELDRQERTKRSEMDEKRLQMEEKRNKIELELFANQQELIKLILKKDHL